MCGVLHGCVLAIGPRTVLSKDHGVFSRFLTSWAEFQAMMSYTGRSVGALVLREMSSTYGRSPGGYIWAVIEPIGAILVLSLAFSLLLRAPSLGTSFLLFYCTGYMPFRVYQDIEGKVGGALNYSRPLLAYPRVLWIDAVMARFLLNLVTITTVFFLVASGILLSIDSHTVLEFAPIAIGIGITASTGLGVGMINAVLKGLFPVWGQIWSILSRPLLIASGLFFIYEDLPQMAQTILWWNPLFHGTGIVRSGFYPTYDADYVSLTYCFGLSFFFIAMGLLLMRANYKKVLEL